MNYNYLETSLICPVLAVAATATRQLSRGRSIFCVQSVTAIYEYI